VNETNHYEIAIPKIGSWSSLTPMTGVVPGLKDVPRDQRPPVWPVFFSFRIMVGIGFCMLGSGCGAFGCAGGALFENAGFLRAAMLMTPVGLRRRAVRLVHGRDRRQPYVVYGLLRTADAVSPISRPRCEFTRGPSASSTWSCSGSAATTSRSSCAKGPEPLEEASAGRFRSAHRQDARSAPLGPDESLRGAGRRVQPAGVGPMFGFGSGIRGAAFWLPLIWAGLIAVAVAMYVVVDGFDLGSASCSRRQERELARPHDVLGRADLGRQRDLAGARRRRPAGRVPPRLRDPDAGAVRAADRHAAGARLSAGVAFEFRFKADRSKVVWDYAFHYGSLVATFAQGVVLGAFVQVLRSRAAVLRAGRSTG
jgi:hypothetical protein